MSMSEAKSMVEFLSDRGRVLAIALVILFSPIARGADCDPDVKGKDRITKQEVVQWQQVLTASGILSAALLEKDITFTAYVGRVGDKNLVGIVVQKVEENLARAAFETQFRAAKGDQFLLGFRNGGPVTFVTTKAANAAQAGTFSGKLNLSASWEAEVSDVDMAAHRDALTTQLIDAIRITAASGQIDRAVPEKNGQRLKQKFGCFFRSFDYAGGSGAGGDQPESGPSVGAVVSRKASSASPLEAAVRSTANCRSNFTVRGSMVRGTSYESYDEYPGVGYAAGLGIVESILARASFSIVSSEKTAGTIIAAGENERGKDIRYAFSVVPTSGGVRVTIREDLRVGKHGADGSVRDAMCRVLSSIAEAVAVAEAATPAPPQTAKSPSSAPVRAAEALAPKSASPSTVEERLRQLEELYKKGVITEEEYKKKRAQILSSL